MTDPTPPVAPAPRRFRGGIAGIVFVLAFLLSVSWARQGARAPLVEERRDRLAELVVQRQQRADAIERELIRLRARAESLARGKGPAAAFQDEIERLAVFAGTAPVSGPGVAVELADSPQAAQEGSPDFRIQDVDLQLIVNALWSAGAEAIAVNGQRIVSTSAIRSAGQAILVNYNVLTSPYRIEAIGDPEGIQVRFDESEIAERFRTWSQVYRLSIKVRSATSITLPAYTGSVRPRHAEPVES
ncbi:MAG TPA: DUF881 domain-containing protein [Actinomycetota bacterium]|nr:DUF881 domain-containing protein [Actinomycetota bacterium]